MKTLRVQLDDEKGRPAARSHVSAPKTLTEGEPEDHEHRLAREFREVVKRPLIAIGMAAYELHVGRELVKNTRARAFAELAVTGELSNASFEALAPQGLAERSIRAAQVEHGDLPNTATTRKHAERAITYARAVSKALRASTDVERRAARRAVPSLDGRPPRYVAVSGEDDSPDRPVNISCSSHLLDDLDVPVRALGSSPSAYPELRIRFARNESFNDRSAPLVVLVHGLGSRLEENDEVMRHLDEAGVAAVAMDVPNQGYSQRISFAKAGIAQDMQETGVSLAKPFRGIEFYDHFVRSFVETLDASFPAAQVKTRVALVAGGSQGGTLALRLGFHATPDWLPRVAAWSPGSVWQSFHTDDGWHWLAVGSMGPLSQIRREEDVSARREYIRGIFEPRFPTNLLFGRIADTWWRRTQNYATRKAAHIAGARAQRHELYDEWHRRWCSAMEQEQLGHSFRGNDDDPNWKFTRTNVPMLLMAGDADEFSFANIYTSCQALATRATSVGKPAGTFVELTNTGHSMHDERPARLAQMLALHARGEPIED